MYDVLIGSVQSYECRDAVRDFVDAAFRMDETLDEFLGASEKPRLVVVKPNWIAEARQNRPDVWEPVITHPVLIMAVLESLAERMKGLGIICLCDGPATVANLSAILDRGNLRDGIDEFRKRWPALRVEVQDLRREIWTWKEQVIVERLPNIPDSRGYVSMNLGKDSLFYGYHGEGRYYGADYNTHEVNSHHSGDIQEYLLAGAPLACDLFINLPKLKTHKKTGITCCLKNLVGINGNKNWLPHHIEGDPSSGGDEFSSQSLLNTIESRLKKFGQRLALIFPCVGTYLYRKMRNSGIALLGDSEKKIRAGNWQGNDTCWRMVLDLNRALLYGNCDGTWRETGKPKKYLAIVDGIVGGEGSGPLCPDPVKSRILVAGTSPAETDAVAAQIMGFPLSHLSVIERAFDHHRWPIYKRQIHEIRIYDMRFDEQVSVENLKAVVSGGFKPHFGWSGMAVDHR